jgi:hypothetical protein
MGQDIPVKDALAEIDKRIKVLEGLDKAIEKQIQDEEKRPPLSDFTGLTKAYMNIIKLAAINASPSCVVAIQKAEKQPEPANLMAARKALEEHGKKAKDTPKTGPAFEKNIASLIKELDMVIKDAK